MRINLTVKQTMATHGTLSAFNPATEPWTTCTEGLQYYFIAKCSQMRRSVQYYCQCMCGPVTYKTICSIIDIDILSSIKYDELIEMLKSHYDPKPSFIVQHFKFYNRTQEASEIVSTFIVAL